MALTDNSEGGDAQDAGESNPDESDQLDERFCIRCNEERAEQMSRVAPKQDGLLSRIDQQLGSLT